MDRQENDTRKYDDIINLPHPVSTTHPRMSVADRAAQFSPFAALTGHGAAIQETARLTEQRRELDENSKVELDRKLQVLRYYAKDKPEITLTYFQPDERKAGGAYITVTGKIQKMDDYKRVVVLKDGTTISIVDIMDMKGEIFSWAE